MAYEPKRRLEQAEVPRGEPPRDEVTRLLSAAAHLDSDFATQAIREFLSEPLRATVPSPGVDAPAVLRETVAARTRRRLRDGILAVLLVGFALASPIGLAVWATVAAVWKGIGPNKRRLDRRRRSRPSPALMLVILGVCLLPILFLAIAAGSVGSGSAGRFGSDAGSFGEIDGGSSGLGAVRLVFAVLLPLAAAMILLTDRIMVWSLLTKSFRRGQFSAEPAAGERLRTLGTDTPNGRELLSRAADHIGNAVVYLGDKPFIGHGRTYRTWSITIPLEPRETEGNGHHPPDAERLPPAFGLSDLYDHIGASVEQLRGSSRALSPSYRLSELEQFETLVVPADDLVSHFGEQSANLVLPNPYRPPTLQIDPARLHAVAEGPIEWMRYYRGFRVETWERDLVVSMFIHIGADRDMLYFECTPCVLPSIQSAYRQIDQMSLTSQAPAVADALGSLVALPISIFVRLWSAFRSVRPPGGTNELRSDRYGAQFSLRELAAEQNVHDYLKGRDVDRYLTLLEDRIFKATASFLRSRGISSTTFEEKVRMIQNAFNFTDSTFVNSAFGSGNSVGSPAPTAPAPSGAGGG